MIFVNFSSRYNLFFPWSPLPTAEGRYASATVAYAEDLMGRHRIREAQLIIDELLSEERVPGHRGAQVLRERLQDPDWTKGETDYLLELTRRFELRWPVIYDRWSEHFEYGSPTSDTEMLVI